MPVEQKPRSSAWQSAITTLLEVQPPFVPEGAHAMTVVVEFPPGDPGTPPHRHSGPCFGYVLDGEMVFELEGEPARVVRAGEAFWEPGGDVIHYQNGNHRADINGPVNVARLPQAPSLAELAEAGVARVSWGTFLHLDAMARFAEQLALLQK